MKIAKYMNYFIFASVFGGVFYFVFMIPVFPKIANEMGFIFWIVLMFLEITFDLQ